MGRTGRTPRRKRLAPTMEAPFGVLVGPAMPAVLVELGFLSNPEEEAKLQDAAYRADLVEALVRAIARYKGLAEAPETPPAPAGPAAQPTPSGATPAIPP